MSQLILIDGHYFLHRSFSIPFRFHSRNGTPLHVITTYLSLLRRAVKVVPGEEKRLIVVFDSEGVTDNHQLLDQYKSNRKDRYKDQDDNPFMHLPYVKQVIEYLGINQIAKPGHEADDLIASISQNHIESGVEMKAFVVSHDSDFYQLASEQLNIVRLGRKGQNVFADHNWVMKEYSVHPEEYVELKSWVGDTADNIPGIFGIGYKRGAEIINGQRVRSLSTDEQRVLERNRKLIKLNRDIDVQIKGSPVQKLMSYSNNEIFDELGF